MEIKSCKKIKKINTIVVRQAYEDSLQDNTRSQQRSG